LLHGFPQSPAERDRMIERIAESRVSDPAADEFDEVDPADVAREYFATQATLARAFTRKMEHLAARAPRFTRRSAARPRGARRARRATRLAARAGAGSGDPDPGPEAPRPRDAVGRRDGHRHDVALPVGGLGAAVQCADAALAELAGALATVSAVGVSTTVVPAAATTAVPNGSRDLGELQAPGALEPVDDGDIGIFETTEPATSFANGVAAGRDGRDSDHRDVSNFSRVGAVGCPPCSSPTSFFAGSRAHVERGADQPETPQRAAFGHAGGRRAT
jgi:hypothetical protein